MQDAMATNKIYKFKNNLQYKSNHFTWQLFLGVFIDNYLILKISKSLKEKFGWWPEKHHKFWL